jgi:hypothetical protein
LSAAWKYPIVPSLGICATLSEPAAFAAGETPSTSADAASAPADTTERIFFKIFFLSLLVIFPLHIYVKH